MAIKLTVCRECGSPISSKNVASWKDLDNGREMFWTCPSCDGSGSIVFSSAVLHLLAGSFQRQVDERLMDYFRGVLAQVNDLGDIVEWVEV